MTILKAHFANGGAFLEHYLSELISRCSLIVGAYEPVGNAPCEHDEHTAILDHLEARDAAGAIAHMMAHLRSLEARIETSRMPGANGLAHLLGIDPAQRTAVE